MSCSDPIFQVQHIFLCQGTPTDNYTPLPQTTTVADPQTTSSNAADSNPNPAATDSFAKPAEIATIVGSIVGFFALVVSVWGVFLVRKKIKERKRRATVREIESSY